MSQAGTPLAADGRDVQPRLTPSVLPSPPKRTVKLSTLFPRNLLNIGLVFTVWVRKKSGRLILLHLIISFAEEMAFKKRRDGSPGLLSPMRLIVSAHSLAVSLSYQDLWEALQANNFVVEDTVEHLMAQMASEGL
jgi:hypothetical protein